MRVKLEATVETDTAPELIRRALLEFTGKRPKIWPQLDPKTYRVHWVGEVSAEVTEGSPMPMVWSREHYDWSHPTIITWTAVESNFCTPGSHVSLDITSNGGGGSRVDVIWDRTAANLRGRLNLTVIRLGGNRLLGWATRRSLSDVAKAYANGSL